MDFLVAIGSSIVGKIGEHTVVPIGRQFGYLFYYESNIKNLKEQFRHLKDTKQDLQHSVDVATRRGEEIKQSVKTWLSQADSISKMVESFLSEEGQANTGCSIKSFPNLVLRHQLSRRAKKMAQSVIEIKEAASKFDKVSDVPILQNIIETKGYMDFDTRNLILKGIMEALRNNDIRMIGVYGMAGVGKTTLAKEVAKRALEAKLFDDAVEVTVSAFPKLEKIQQEIPDRLGLKFDEDGVKARAVRLRHRLRKEEKFLIILDDVWKKLDLLDIGICFEDDQKGCKILITSRYQGVLEDDIGVDKNFKVELLSDSEAWSCFLKIVGDNLLSDENSDEFKHLTTQIVKECACLPLTIITVAHALKNKGIHFWKDALRRLQRSSMDENVYSSVKLSYDFLENEESRWILLFCSLYEEDAEISFDDLLNLCIGWDLFTDVYTLEESRNRLQTLLDELKSHCLLLKGNERDSVKMHDVIHDVGISIAASEDFKMYNIRSNDQLKKYLDYSNKLKDSIAISLGANVEHQFLPSRLNCANLRLLSMGRERCSLPDKFFEETKKLRVLNLSFLSLETLPSSFLCLENLQVLHLFRVEVEDIHLIGELKKLKVLDFGGSKIKQLPKQIGQLTCLCKLDLSNCYSLRVVPPNVISRLVNLEELNMLQSFKNWKAEGEVDDENTSSSASLSEVKNLTKLTALYLEIPHVNMLPNDLFSTKLERYYILLEGWGVEIMEGSRGLKLNLESDTRSLLKERGFQMLLKRSENLHLEKFHGLKNIVCDLDKEGGLSHLKALKVYRNHEIQYIIDYSSMEPSHISDHSVLPSLETFEFVGVENLEKICHGELRGAKSLRKLRQADVDLCKKLKNLLPFFIANKLEKIKVSDCLTMEEIVTFERHDVINLEAVDRIEFHNLKYMVLWTLPQLTGFCSETDTSIGTPDQGQEGKEQLYHSDSSSTLFNQKVALPSLEVLELGKLQFKRIWADQLPQTCQNLRELSVYRCNSLKYLLSFAIAKNLVKLEKLRVQECDNMGKIIIIKKPTVTIDKFDDQLDIIEFPELKQMYLLYLPQIIQFCSQSHEGQGSDREQVWLADSACSLFNEKVAFPSLEELNLWKLKSIKRIWPNQLPETCKPHNLRRLYLWRCDSLKYVLPFAIAKSLVQLKKLTISQCEGLEEIIMIKEPKQEVEKIDKKLLSKLENVVLSNLPNLTRFCSIETNICGLNFIPEVNISDCPKLFSCTAKKEEDKHMDLQEKTSMRSPCAEKVECFSAGLGTSSFNSVRRIPYDPLVPNLTTMLTVRRCDNVENLLSASMAKGFVHLRTLQVSYCKLLKEVVVTEESGDGIRSQKICFPALKSLELSNLQSLVKFWAGDHIECSFLETLKIFYCPQLSTFISNSTDKAVQPVLFNNQKIAFPKLRILRLERCDSVIEIWHDDDTTDRGQQNAAAGRSRSAFRSLEFLRVSECRSLNKLEANSSVSFETLTILEVLKCDRMEYLFTPSAAKTLVLLKKMGVSECQAMKEIIASSSSSEGNHDDKLLVASFDNLELLVLHSLPSLTSFHMGKCALKFPKLSRVVVAGNCPELRCFCAHGTITNPNLRTFVRRRGQTYWGLDRRQFVERDSLDEWFDPFAADAEKDDKIELLEGEGGNIDINTTIQQFWENHHAQK